MDAKVELASDVIAGGTALAGLILVYLGGVVAGYASFAPAAQAAVRGGYQRKAWFGFVGVLLGMVAAGIALVGRWRADEHLVAISIVLLLVTLVWAIITAILSALEVR